MSRYRTKPTDQELLEADLPALREIWGQAIEIKAINVRKQAQREQDKMQRTSQQNKALQLGARQLAETLNDAGLDARTVLKPTVRLDWTQEMVLNNLYKPILEAMYPGKTSTTELETDEISKVWTTLNRHLAEKFGVQVPFPSSEE